MLWIGNGWVGGEIEEEEEEEEEVICAESLHRREVGIHPPTHPPTHPPIHSQTKRERR